ncbi:molybdopterin-dependent oxidoreductase [Lysobacter sp. CA199]|uniref:molybdopterin-dependent oxidoreductase n=1 Tax=Lysobacter sp. CA199 TaxID=3455608 RepID=UPI003F8D2174
MKARPLGWILALAFAAGAVQAQTPHRHATAQPAAPLGPVEVELDPALIARLPQIQAQGEAHGRKLSCEGVALHELLRASGAMPAEPLRGAQLARVVVVRARDGYRAAFSLAELDPSLGNRQVVLTRRCNGAAVPAEDGPWRLIAPGESRPARWVKQVESIRVVDAT